MSRHHDPATGLFTTRDPLTATTTDPYSYAANNPANTTDPTGLMVGALAAGAAAVGVGISGAALAFAAGVAVVGAAAGWTVYLASDDPGRIPFMVIGQILGGALGAWAGATCYDHYAKDTPSTDGDGHSDEVPSVSPNFVDPSQAPGEGWEWRGGGAPGSPHGSWHNPTTGESLDPDLAHGAPVGPHYDWTSPTGGKYRVHEDGRVVPK